MIILRLIACLALFCLPFLALVILSGRPENALYLIFPFFGAIPAALGALLVFAPIEWLLDRWGLGRLKNLAIPLAGGLLIFLFVLAMGAASGSLGRMLERFAAGGPGELWPFLVWSALGVIWGALWRLTAWIGTRLKRRFGRRESSAPGSQAPS